MRNTLIKIHNISSFVFFLALGLLTFLSCHKSSTDGGQNEPPSKIRNFTYRILNTFPHDPDAFTQGLIYNDNVLYEGTGLFGQSTLRKVGLESGQILKSINLPSQYFGEGITLVENRLIQLTWLSHTGFIYDKNSFDKICEFSYPTEGWGITFDGNRLIMSDGTPTLHFLDTLTFRETGSLQVQDNGVPVYRLNELEYVKGEIYANVWQTDRIAIISLESGQVTGWIDLKVLLSPTACPQPVDVLNGIAYDPVADRLFVTGKFWCKLFEIEVIPVEN